MSETEDNNKTVKYMNTYRLESKKPFNVETVNKILHEILYRELEDVRYDPEANTNLAKQLSVEIRDQVKAMGFDRYKITCVVTIGEKKLHDVYMCVKFLWDHERDNFSICTFENMFIYAVGMVFGIYYE